MSQTFLILFLFLGLSDGQLLRANSGRDGKNDSKENARLMQESEFCASGYIMDKFCIQRGSLLDNSRIGSLSSEGPEAHSIHCLVDIGVCRNSGYEMLSAPTSDEGSFGRAFEFDDAGNAMVLAEARRVGEKGYCTSCTNGEGDQVRGFFATAIGVLDNSNGDLPRLMTHKLVSGEVDCETLRENQSSSSATLSPNSPAPVSSAPVSLAPVSPAPIPAAMSNPVMMTSVIEQDWVIPQQPLPEIDVEVGQTIRFNWNGPHNVYLHPTGTCDEEGAIKVGEETGASYTFTSDDIGSTLFFSCDVGQHCELDQFLKARVTNPTNDENNSNGEGDDSNSEFATVIEKDWFIPQEPFSEISVEVGITIKFNWMRNHNVYLHPTGTCNKEGAIIVGEETGATYTTTLADVGSTLFFSCDVSQHCELNQYLKVNVIESSDDENDSDGEGGMGGGLGFCFSGVNTVVTRDRGTILMSQLRVGDYVLTADSKVPIEESVGKVACNNNNSNSHNLKYEQVYSFGHYDPNIKGKFYQLNNKLELTANHMVYIQGKGFIPASAVQLGDTLVSPNEKNQIVHSIRSNVSRKGVYAPFTTSGTIIVNNILSSAYIALPKINNKSRDDNDSISLMSSAVLQLGSWSTPFTFQWLSHSYMTPHRIWCHFLGLPDPTMEGNGEGVSLFSGLSMQIIQWFLKQNTTVIVSLSLPFLAMLVFWNMAESLLLMSLELQQIIFYTTIALITIATKALIRKNHKLKNV